MKKIQLVILAILAAGLAACATTKENASARATQVGTSATDAAQQATSSAVNQQVQEATGGFWHKIFGH